MSPNAKTPVKARWAARGAKVEVPRAAEDASRVANPGDASAEARGRTGEPQAEVFSSRSKSTSGG